MKISYYTADSLESELREFEQRFGLSSTAFYAAHMRDDAPVEIDPFDRFLWAQTYRDAGRLRVRVASPPPKGECPRAG